jgi:hypothetical protein
MFLKHVVLGMPVLILQRPKVYYALEQSAQSREIGLDSPGVGWRCSRRHQNRIHDRVLDLEYDETKFTTYIPPSQPPAPKD